MAQTSPWAGVPYNPDVTQADINPSVWASPETMGGGMPQLPQPALPNVTVQKPVMDLHANLPPVFAPTPKPNPQDEITGHLQGQLENDYQKDANPWGSPTNHPGFLGKLVHGLSVATGGNTRRGWEEQGLAKQLNDVVGDEATNKYKGAETAKTQEETAEAPQRASDAHSLSGATTEHLGAETNALENPAPEYEVHDTAQGPMIVNKKTGVGQHLAVNGLPVGPKVATKTVQLQIGGQDHQVLINDTDGTVIKDLGVGGIKPPSVHVDTGQKNLWSVPQPDGTRKAVSIKAGDVIPKGAVSLSGQNSENVAGDKTEHASETAAANLDSELGLMKQFAASPSPTNDAAMLMHYIGATKPESMGKIRLNDKEIKLFGGTRSSLGDAEALLTKVANGQSLTPKQRGDMINTMTMIDQAAKRGDAGGSAPQGADNEVYVGGNLVGHTVGGRYVALGGK